MAPTLRAFRAECSVFVSLCVRLAKVARTTGGQEPSWTRWCYMDMTAVAASKRALMIFWK